jgi:mono/diheme cytochrome c family protein
MKKAIFLAVSMLAAACAPSQPGVTAAAGPGNASLGLRYAEQNCASCHAITVGAATSPVPEATPFDTIANTPGMTRIALNAWLHTSHPSMPNFIIDQAHIDDVSAYLETLKRDRR